MISPKNSQVLGSGIGAGRAESMTCASRFRLGFVTVGLELLKWSSCSTSLSPFLVNWPRESFPPRNCDSSLPELAVVVVDGAGVGVLAVIWTGGVNAAPVFEPS